MITSMPVENARQLLPARTRQVLLYCLALFSNALVHTSDNADKFYDIPLNVLNNKN